MEQLRIFLFAALGILLFFAWNAWEKDYPSHVPATAINGQPVTPPTAVTPPAAPAAPAAPQAPQAPGATPAPAVASTGEIIQVQTDLLDVGISTRGGDIQYARLRTYSVSSENPEPFAVLKSDGTHPFTAQIGLGTQQAPMLTGSAIFAAPARQFVLAEGQDEVVVPLTWTSPEGVTVTKRYVFKRNRYEIDIDQQVRNDSAAPWQAVQYAQFLRVPEEHKRSIFFVNTYSGAVINSPAKRYEKVSFEDMTETPIRRDVENGWLALIQHYFLAAWVPPRETTQHYYSHQTGTAYQLGMFSPWQTVAPGGTGSFHQQLYVGPKEPSRLAAVAPDLELTVDYGKLTVIAQPLYWLLSKIHSVVGNWGWSIVLLTLMIKLVFYKLSETSYRSMARMRTMQPKMQALKERYGDDRQRLNQELMELYKREKINPLGGCLPIVVQIPVFIALYWVLLESVELRQADWILWIKDLSAPDPFFVLPIIMGVSMLAQQKLNPSPMDPIQQRVMMVLPIVFTVFFLFFPAGLVLYWVTNNLLSIGQQWLITRRIEKAAAAK